MCSSELIQNSPADPFKVRKGLLICVESAAGPALPA
jgi:hypothetical protein